MIGKRKREKSVVSRSKSKKGAEEPAAAAESKSNAQNIFRKFFEAQFQPLEVEGASAGADESDSESDEEGDEEDGSEDSEAGSDFSGFDDEEEEENAPVEVVEYQAPSRSTDLMDKRARKAFMTAKPPSFSTDLGRATDRSNKAQDGDKDEDAESLNLENDLALQRLLKESHLLESASDLAPTGKNRHKALDLRMQELGAKKSLYHQKNMPSSMRKGIKAKAVLKEDKRRREARENGIILEKPAPKKQIGNGSERRERGVGGPSIGKFAGGTLNLSKRDIAQVQASRRGGGRSRGRGGTSRGRR
ncbi:hypothetical protein BDV19DRAFT_4824 [Aspergillus venezuelensis]